MPIYEFYCRTCNTIYSFLSRTVNTKKRPACPKCRQRNLDRLLSPFAATGRAREGSAGKDPPVDEARMEGAMESLAQEAEGMNEEDPRQAAALMRKLSKMSGMKMGEGMEQALNRLEAGEDPEQIEAELGDRLEKEEPFELPDDSAKGKRKARPAPAKRDGTLYEM